MTRGIDSHFLADSTDDFMRAACRLKSFFYWERRSIRFWYDIIWLLRIPLAAVSGLATLYFSGWFYAALVVVSVHAGVSFVLFMFVCAKELSSRRILRDFDNLFPRDDSVRHAALMIVHYMSFQDTTEVHRGHDFTGQISSMLYFHTKKEIKDVGLEGIWSRIWFDEKETYDRRRFPGHVK